jgi:hypothetical protein
MKYIEDITKWFAEHHSTRKFVKWAVISFVGYMVANLTELVAAIPVEYQPFLAPLLIGIVAYADNFIKHNETLPIVGAKKK